MKLWSPPKELKTFLFNNILKGATLQVRYSENELKKWTQDVFKKLREILKTLEHLLLFTSRNLWNTSVSTDFQSFKGTVMRIRIYPS